MIGSLFEMRRMLRAPHVAALLIMVLTGAPAMGRPASNASDISAATSRVWAALLQRCGETYIYTGSPLDEMGVMKYTAPEPIKSVEYKGVRFASVPIRITDAERANGLTAHARITMRAHLYRIDGALWQDGPDVRPRNTRDLARQASSEADGDMFYMGTGGAIALELYNSGGRWYVVRSSTTWSGPISEDAQSFDLENLITSPRQAYDCNQHAVVGPKPVYTP